MWWDCLSQNMQCHSLAVGHRKRSDETAFHKMCNITHLLLVVGKDWMRLPSTKCATHILLVIGKDLIKQNVQCHSQSIGHRTISDETAFHTMCNATHNLLVIEKMWWDCLSQHVQCHPHPVVEDWRCEETAFHTMYNVTHSLLVIGKCDETAFHQICKSLTPCWTWEKMWWGLAPTKPSMLLTSYHM